MTRTPAWVPDSPSGSVPDGPAGPSPVAVRPAMPGDADALADLHLRSMRSAYASFVSAADLGSITAEGLRERWRERLTSATEAATTLVADGLAGFVTVGPSRDDDARPRDGELHALYVEPGLQRRGVGEALLVTGERELEACYDAATLWVLEPNVVARRFYERHGWALDDAPFDPGRWGWSPSLRLRKVLAR